MLQQRMAFRAIRLPFRCLTAPRSYATAAESTPSPFPSFEQNPFTPPPETQQAGPRIRKYTPRTPGTRHLRRAINDHLWKGRPVQNLTFPKRGHGKGGRNNAGRVTVRHRGGGHKRRIRTVDFARKAPGPHVVERIEHDPGRSAHIALIRSKETNKVSYIVAPEGTRAGEVVQSYMSGIPRDLWESMGGIMDPGVLAARTAWRGNCLPLHMIPVGTVIFNVGLYPGKGGELCRSAGTHATVITKGQEKADDAQRREGQQMQMEEVEPSKPAAQAEQAQQTEQTQPGEQIQQVQQTARPEKPKVSADEKKKLQQEKLKKEQAAQFVTLRLQSGEIRLIHRNCCATVGIASNASKQYAQLGKAGRSRWLNIRPTVRGVAMNAADHPHGGGRGKSKGNRHPTSPWGTLVSLYCRRCDCTLLTSLGQIWVQDSSQVESQQGRGGWATSLARQASQCQEVKACCLRYYACHLLF